MNCGIYSLSNETNGKIYIGSTINFERRRKEHFRHLKYNKHKNKHLQSAYNLGDKFIFKIIEVCDKEQLEIVESKWMKFYNASNREYGYNLWDLAPRPKMSEETKKKIGQANKYKLVGNKSPLSKKAVLRSPSGEKVEIDCIRVFAKQNNLGSSHLSAVCRGVLRECHGWTLWSAGEMVFPKFVSKDGEIREVHNLSEFAKEIGGSVSAVSLVLSGKKISHYGWRLYSFGKTRGL